MRILLAAFLFLMVAAIIPAFRPALLSAFKLPLDAIGFFESELGAMVMYRFNYFRNRSLNMQVDALRQKLNQSREVYLENERLQKLLNFKSESSFAVIPARVIASSADNWSSMIVINKGRAGGIKKGYVVITYLGLAGRVIEVSAQTSKAVLIGDPSLCVSAIVSRSREEGLVCGTLGKFLSMRYLSRESDIRPQDTIVTSGLSEFYPKGLLLGTVVDVEEEFSGLSRYAVLKPAVNLSNLEEVLVVVP